jgi:Sortase domain
MPRWLTTLFVLLLLFVFVVPDPVSAGNATGNAINSLVVFFKSAGDEVSDTLSVPGSSTYGDGGSSYSSSGSEVYPRGGVPSGDGTTYDGDDTLLLGLESAPAPARVDTLATEGALAHSPPVQLSIPSIGVTSGFVGLGLESDGTMEVPQAAHVVGWYRDAPSPGERGPAVATAHVDWKHEKGVFHDLGQLKSGSDVTVDRADGAAVVFRVTRVAEYSKASFPTEEVYGGTDAAELRLITCGGRFDPASHNYEDNIVVFARMVAVT